MKAKPYYANHLALTSKRPTPCGLNIREGEGDVSVLVIPASAMDKVIEQAAKVLSRNSGNGPWGTVTKTNQNHWLEDARAAYRAGGFVS